MIERLAKWYSRERLRKKLCINMVGVVARWCKMWCFTNFVKTLMLSKNILFTLFHLGHFLNAKKRVGSKNDSKTCRGLKWMVPYFISEISKCQKEGRF